jgi:hypothetical protein
MVTADDELACQQYLDGRIAREHQSFHPQFVAAIRAAWNAALAYDRAKEQERARADVAQLVEVAEE